MKEEVLYLLLHQFYNHPHHNREHDYHRYCKSECKGHDPLPFPTMSGTLSIPEVRAESYP